MSLLFQKKKNVLYVCNLFLYLNYHPTDDFIVNLDNVRKFIGFSNKANGKRLLKQHFTENKDYKVTLLQTGKRESKVIGKNDDKTLLIRTDEQKNKDNRGGYNQETIMLNINIYV